MDFCFEGGLEWGREERDWVEGVESVDGGIGEG